MTWIDIDAATVADAMGTIRKIVGTSRMHPIASTVRISHDRSTTLVERTNMSDRVRAILSGTSAWPSWGPYVVDAAAFATAVGKRGTVRIAPNADMSALLFVSENGETSVPVSSVDWPGPDVHEYTSVATVADSELRRVASVADVARRIAADARAILHAVSIDTDGTVLATDRFRAHGTRIADVSRASLVDGTVLHVATSSADGEVHISATDGDANGRTLVEWTATRGPKKNPRTVHYVASSYRPEGPYPNVLSVIPRDDVANAWTIRDASGTADVLRTFRSSESVPVLFASAGSAIRATVSENGTERSAILPIAPDPSDNPDTMAANPHFIRDAIAHVGDNGRVHMFGGLRPFHMRADDDSETFALVMPMRIG